MNRTRSLHAESPTRAFTLVELLVVIAIIAYAFDHLVRFVERRVVPWKGRG